MFNCFGKSKKNENLPQSNSKELIKSLGEISQEVKNLNQSLQNLNSEKQTKTTIRYNIVNTYLPIFTLVSFLLGGAITFSYLKEIDALEYFHTSLSLEQFALTTIIIALYLLFIIITIAAPTIKTFIVFNNTITIRDDKIFKESCWHIIANTLIFILTPLIVFFFPDYRSLLWFLFIAVLSIISNRNRLNRKIDTDTTLLLCIIDFFTYLFVHFSIIYLTGKTIDDISDKDLLYSYLSIVFIGSFANIVCYLSIIHNKKPSSKNIDVNFKSTICMAVVLFILLIIQPIFPFKTSELAFRVIGIRDTSPKEYLIDKTFATEDLGITYTNGNKENKYIVQVGMVIWRDKDITFFVKKGDKPQEHIAIPSNNIKKCTSKIHSKQYKECNTKIPNVFNIAISIAESFSKTK